MTTTLDELTAAAEARFLDLWEQGPSLVTWTELPPQVGDPAPDLELPDHTGRPTRLSETWRSGPALLVFWRQFGCGCGVARAERLRKEYADYVAAGASVVVIGQGEPERAAQYRSAQELEMPVLCDPGHTAYHAYGLRDGTVAQILFDAPRDMWTHDRAIGAEFARSRREQGRPLVDSPWLLPGEFVVGIDGVIRHAHRYQHCEDYPEPLVLLAAITG